MENFDFKSSIDNSSSKQLAMITTGVSKQNVITKAKHFQKEKTESIAERTFEQSIEHTNSFNNLEDLNHTNSIKNGALVNAGSSIITDQQKIINNDLRRLQSQESPNFQKQSSNIIKTLETDQHLNDDASNINFMNDESQNGYSPVNPKFQLSKNNSKDVQPFHQELTKFNEQQLSYFDRQQSSTTSNQLTTVTQRFAEQGFNGNTFRKENGIYQLSTAHKFNYLSTGAPGSIVNKSNYDPSDSVISSSDKANNRGRNEQQQFQSVDIKSIQSSMEIQQKIMKNKFRIHLQKKFKEEALDDEEYKSPHNQMIKIVESDSGSSNVDMHSRRFGQKTTNFNDSQIDEMYGQSSNLRYEQAKKQNKAMKAKSALQIQQLNAVRVHPRFRKTVQFQPEMMGIQHQSMDAQTYHQRPNSDLQYSSNQRKMLGSTQGSFFRMSNNINNRGYIEETLFQQIQYPMNLLYKFYFEGANLVSENSKNEIELEYLDGSKFKGEFYDTGKKGEFKKKPKNNHSYYQSYKGEFCEDMPQGKNGELEIKLSNWPKYHPLMTQHKWYLFKQKARQQSIQFKGEFIDGHLDGLCEVSLNKTKNYSTLFQQGLEIPQSKELKDISTDRMFINFALFLSFIICLIIGGLYDIKGLYAAAILYVLQFMEYCCSSTKNTIQNIENLEQVKNLLIEYQKWRPIVFLHYRFEEEKKKEKEKQQLKEKRVLPLDANQSNTIKTQPCPEESIKPAENPDPNDDKNSVNLNSSIQLNRSDLQNSRNLSIDLHSLIAAIEDNDKDVLEEFKYSMWQDLSPEVSTFDIFDAKSTKFIKLNIYKIFDFTTFAQWQLQK